ncbi:MAG: DUF1816 domain-containing protein [Phormidesmis sp. RL_2_1]|nr:DUF1816 domain-containing protein [Phormidesmis sp. RL_2_1]
MNSLKRLFSIVHNRKQPWWIKIQTQTPECTYYFGPFDSKKEAIVSQTGYVEDLVQEGAQHVISALEKTRPARLTSCVFDEPCL